MKILDTCQLTIFYQQADDKAYKVGTSGKSNKETVSEVISLKFKSLINTLTYHFKLDFEFKINKLD